LTERQKMMDRIKKIKQRRGKFEEGSKICKKCGKDYIEKENYNWSCVTHQSEFSGELWWCCGKTTKEARGCKFQKHEKQDEDDEVHDQKMLYDKFSKKCRCCKEVGHSIEVCPRDPNIRTLGTAVENDFQRIVRSKSAKKLAAETQIITT
jgi:hypothetical protein